MGRSPGSTWRSRTSLLMSLHSGQVCPVGLILNVRHSQASRLQTGCDVEGAGPGNQRPTKARRGSCAPPFAGLLWVKRPIATDEPHRPMTALAPRDLLTLAVLADGPSHGYGIIKAVEDRSGNDVLLDPANLYRCLRRMSGDGWIAEIEARTGDERRRTFRITPRGREVLMDEVQRLQSLLRGLRPSLAGHKR